MIRGKIILVVALFLSLALNIVFATLYISLASKSTTFYDAHVDGYVLTQSGTSVSDVLIYFYLPDFTSWSQDRKPNFVMFTDRNGYYQLDFLYTEKAGHLTIIVKNQSSYVPIINGNTQESYSVDLLMTHGFVGTFNFTLANKLIGCGLCGGG